MKEAIYYKRNMAIINYTKKYCVNAQELISSEGFQQFLDLFFNHLATHNLELYNWLFEGARISDVKVEIIKLLKLLLVLEPDEIIHPAMNDRGMLLALIEEGYNFWRNMERYSLIFTKNEEGLQIHNFIEADSEFNQLVLNFYRTIEQKVQGSNNKVYRQLQAGTNASILLQEYNWSVPKGYEALTKIPFINRIMLRTPLIIHPKSNKRIGMFTETKFNPINEFVRNDDEWICFPCKVGSMLTFAYFHRDFMSGAIAAPNLFEMASVHECENHKPDCIVLFGNPDGKNDTSFYYDEKEDIWIGKVSAADVIEYFGYVKKMFLTLHNLAVMKKGWLPIHGAMINLYLKNGQKKGIMFMGDSGAGKSETIEALTYLAKDLIVRQEVVFDDMGSIHINNNGKVVAQGTEIGAFVRLDDLDKGTAYRDMDRSIFFNPESANARVVVPAAPYDVVTTDQTIDCFMYANNYTDKRGLKRFGSVEEAKPSFVEGKRFALGTTQEKGISTTFFANPFGPMQKQEECTPLIDTMFERLFEQNITVGEIYTCLGLPNKGDNGIMDAAQALLDLVNEK